MALELEKNQELAATGQDKVTVLYGTQVAREREIARFSARYKAFNLQFFDHVGKDLNEPIKVLSGCRISATTSVTVLTSGLCTFSRLPKEVLTLGVEVDADFSHCQPISS
ncbi:hypothetical protein QF015_000585 [Paenarthrobacter sp. TE4293]